MAISLRPANPDDKEFCRRVHRLAYRDVVVRQFGQWDDTLQDGFFEREWASLSLQVIEFDGEAVGCFSRDVRPEGISIDQIELLPQFQGRGIGTELLVQQLDEAKQLGLPVRLQVLLENRARSLYEKLGFTICGKTATHYVMESAMGVADPAIHPVLPPDRREETGGEGKGP